MKYEPSTALPCGDLSKVMCACCMIGNCTAISEDFPAPMRSLISYSHYHYNYHDHYHFHYNYHYHDHYHYQYHYHYHWYIRKKVC